MKKNRRWFCAGFILLAGGGIALLLGAGLIYYFYIGPKILDQKRTLASPPSILVRAPQAGDTVPPGSTLMAQATVFGRNPITRVELWLDGEVIGTQTPDSQDHTTVYALLDLEISAGTHILVWRAVDNTGLVGQSAPIPIAGELPLGAGETTTVSAEEGQSLQDIAGVQGVDPGLLQDLNPGLGDGGLPGGTAVNVPLPPGQGATGTRPAPVNAPTPPLPDPPAGKPALLPIKAPLLDLASLVPSLLANLPAAPSDLQAGFENCTIRLVWNDNATNESNFVIWLQAIGGPPRNIYTTDANPGTGQTWFEFASPSFGIYAFWVEAVNALGGQSSEIQGVFVNVDTCGVGVATQLELEALAMSGFMGGGWQQVYCYLSIEGAPEKRVPEDDSQFLKYDYSGGVDISKWIGSKNRILINMPADEVVTLAGDCWGWLGRPLSMGDFSVDVPKEQWDKRTLQIRSRGYVIDFRASVYGPDQPEAVFSYLDTSIEPPTIFSIKQRLTPDPNRNMELARTPMVTWGWFGTGKVTSFSIFIDGNLYMTLPLESVYIDVEDLRLNQTEIQVPTSCGGVYQIQMAANAGDARSGLTTEVEYRQSECETYAVVSFENFYFTSIDDGEDICSDPAELEFSLYVNDAAAKSQSFIEYGSGYEVKCNQVYKFSRFPITDQRGWAYIYGDTGVVRMKVPIDPANPQLEVVVGFYDMDDMGLYYDIDYLCGYKMDLGRYIKPMSYEEWVEFEWILESELCAEKNRGGETDGQGVISYQVQGALFPQP